MQQLKILQSALAYVEENLASNMKTEEIAKACFCSKSALEKIFRCVNNISVHDYISRRRMMKAARMLLENPDLRILDIAVELGFSGNEAFTRAFHQVWNCTPSEYRKKERFVVLFPEYVGYNTVGNGENDMIGRKNVDISELYDLFLTRRSCCFVCGDIKDLLGFNAISRKAGDLAILEALNRMEEAAGEEDFAFRIGADEFVIMTNSEDLEYAQEVAERVLSRNKETFVYEEKQLPLSLYVTVTKLAGNEVRYKELFDELHQSILDSKRG